MTIRDNVNSFNNVLIGLLHNKLRMTEKKYSLCMIAFRVFYKQSGFVLHRKYNVIMEKTIVTSKNTIVIHKTQS